MLGEVPLIVIDGTSGVGKGTIAKMLAQHFGLRHVDTGLMYRAVASRSRETGENPVLVAHSLLPDDLRRIDLRSEEISRLTPPIAKDPSVRAGINASLRVMVATPPGCVIDGRAGAHEFPHAQAKLFLEASDEERARRRLKQLLESGEAATFERVLVDLRERDRLDRERSVAPLIKAPDAHLIDTTELDILAVFSVAFAYCNEQFARAGLLQSTFATRALPTG